MTASRFFAAALAVLLLGGCLPDRVDSQSQALTLSDDSLAVRQMQTRRFETADETLMLGAVTGVLQDLGYTVRETSAGTGLVSATGTRGEKVTLTVRPMAGQMTVRAAFQTPEGVRVTNPALYQRFFNQLSQSVFLEAHQI